MYEDRISFGSSSIHYSWGGTGNKLLLCLHGYGESAASFAFLEDPLGSDFMILALDLPFHGGTEWHDGLFFDPQKLPDLIGNILIRLAFPSGHPDLANPQDRWWVLGYSMGGRVALTLLEQCPDKIAKLILLAPDGLKMNGWYWLATQSRPGNRLFRWAMQKPGCFFFLLRMAEKMNGVNPGIYKFMFKYIGDPKIREELYKRWTVMRGFRPHIRSLRAIISEVHIPVRLLYGRYDRMVRAQNGEKFREGIEPWCSLEILDTGHQLLQKKYLDRLILALKE